MIVRAVTAADAGAWAAMRHALWPEGPLAEHAGEIARFFAGDTRIARAVLVAEDGGQLVGFAELSIRPYAEGCVSDNVAFLEGWYVAPAARGRGVGKALVAAAEAWARAQDCTEFASDAEADNAASAAAHRRLGFEDVGLVRCFRKAL